MNKSILSFSFLILACASPVLAGKYPENAIKKGGQKKTVRFRPDETLNEVRYFEKDAPGASAQSQSQSSVDLSLGGSSSSSSRAQAIDLTNEDDDGEFEAQEPEEPAIFAALRSSSLDPLGNALRVPGAVDAANADGQTALMVAIQHENGHQIRMISSAGPDGSITADDRDHDGWNALHFVARHWTGLTCPSIIAKLVNRLRAHINQAAADGRTPLMVLAGQADRPDRIASGVELLLREGANPRLRDSNGDTAWHHALLAGVSFEVISILSPGPISSSLQPGERQSRLTEVGEAIRMGVYADRVDVVQAIFRLYGTPSNVSEWLNLAANSRSGDVERFLQGLVAQQQSQQQMQQRQSQDAGAASSDSQSQSAASSSASPGAAQSSSSSSRGAQSLGKRSRTTFDDDTAEPLSQAEARRQRTEPPVSTSAPRSAFTSVGRGQPQQQQQVQMPMQQPLQLLLALQQQQRQQQYMQMLLHGLQQQQLQAQQAQAQQQSVTMSTSQFAALSASNGATPSGQIHPPASLPLMMAMPALPQMPQNGLGTMMPSLQQQLPPPSASGQAARTPSAIWQFFQSFGLGGGKPGAGIR